jgi:hypothetical protein
LVQFYKLKEMNSELDTPINQDPSKTLFIPVPSRANESLRLDEKLPYNPYFVNMDIALLEIISKHFHEHPSYTDSCGHPKAIAHLSQHFGVDPADVACVPSVEMARWYLLTLFLNDGDVVACNSGLVPSLTRLRTESKYKIEPLSPGCAGSKMIMLKYPDIDINEPNSHQEGLVHGLKHLDDTLQSPTCIVVEEPFVLMGGSNPYGSITKNALPTNSPVYLVTHLNDVLLNDSSGFAIIVLLNNTQNRFKELNIALENMTVFYNAPNTAIHPLINQILSRLETTSILATFKRLETRKSALFEAFKSKGLQCKMTPKFVFSIGIPKTNEILALVARQEVILNKCEYIRDIDYFFVSVLYSDSVFQHLLDKL